MSDLAAHRTDITTVVGAAKNGLRTTRDPGIWRNVSQHIDTLQASLAKAETEMVAIIREQHDMRDQAARLRQVKVIGPVVSATLIAWRPVTGQLGRRRIAALAGLS